MKSCSLFLLVYMLGILFGETNGQSGGTCTSEESCSQVPDATSHFLQCVGLPSTDTGKDHVQRLKGMLAATMDVYSFMKSSAPNVPFLSLEGALEVNPQADPLQNENLVKMWLEVKLKPLLNSINKHFLSCLSTQSFSCSTYQIVVNELSHHYSEMDPVRQKWIYMFFMYPFLSGDQVAGCVDPEESSEDWLVKNFGAFSGMARMEDFSTLNMVFSGLEVLHLLSPSQKAELLLSPEVESLDNGTLTLVFNNLLTGGPAASPTAVTGGGYSWTEPSYPSMMYTSPQPTEDPYTSSPQDTLQQVVNGFMTALKPIRSFAHEFVTFTQEREISKIKSTTLTQFLLNFTLSELADIYRPQSTIVSELPQFDVTNVEDWYQQVVMPLLRRFLPTDELLTHPNVKLAFQQVFFLNNDVGNDTTDTPDVCSITLDKSAKYCGVSDAVQHLASVLHCAAKTNMTSTETTFVRLIEELTKRLNSLIRELSTSNFNEVASDFQAIFNEEQPSPDLTQENLQDSDFLKLWFQIKLVPILPNVNPDLLSCLSTKNFTCPVYQTLVAELGKQMTIIDADPVYSLNIYQHLIFPFLMHHNTSDPQCVSSANNSAEWLEYNFGVFSKFASITDFYKLNPSFSGVEALHLFSPKQLAEMLLLPLPTPPEKDVVINHVFDFLLQPSEVQKLPEVMMFVVQLAVEIKPPCKIYEHIFIRLYAAIPSMTPQMEPVLQAYMDDLTNIAPEECVAANVTLQCPNTQIFGNICENVDSSDLQFYMNMSTDISCDFTLEKYACGQVNFTADQLAALMMCDLPRNSSHSHMLWKTLLTKHSYVLDSALDSLANMSAVGPSAPEILDVISEIRVSMLTDEQLSDSSIVRLWFSNRLSVFLPSASGRFLLCLSSRNLSCQTYQNILQVFIHQFGNMSLQQQDLIFKDFVFRFLIKPNSGPGCLLNSNGSAEWLRNNWGPFSAFVSLEKLVELNPHFNPLEALLFLTPNQSAELLVLTLPILPDKDTIINTLFDYLTAAPQERKLTEFLFHLVIFIERANLSCSSYKTLYTRLDLALTNVPLEIASSITYSKVTLSKHIPPGCIIYSEECPFTVVNEMDICTGVNSTELQLFLDNGKTSGHFCNFAVEEIACASLSALTAQDLAMILKCDHFHYSSGSTAVWKIIFSKAFMVLDDALDLLTNSTLDYTSPSASIILDAMREIRLDTISTEIFSDPSLIQLWFGQRLRPFLPAVSSEFLSCFATKNMSCSGYQFIIQIMSAVQPHMTLAKQMSISTGFIKVFLTRNNTEDPQCVSSTNNSMEWLGKNFGVFSRLFSVTDFYKLNPNFSGVEVLPLLSPKQLAEMLLLPLPTPPEKDVVINRVFDFLLQPSELQKFPEFMMFVVQLAAKVNPPCNVYEHIFMRLYGAIPSLSPQIEPVFWAYIDNLINMAPPECVPANITCPETLITDKICENVDSSDLQSYMNTFTDISCDFPLEKYACGQVNFTANQLAALMMCDLPRNSSHSHMLWKTLLTKHSYVLDSALDSLANMSAVGPSAPEILDVISEIRVSMLTDEQLSDSSIVRLWFSNRLSVFLPSASGRFLLCLSSRNLSCQTYQNILRVFIHQFENMSLQQQDLIFKDFVLRFLIKLNSGPGCVLNSNGSAEWLRNNWGPFSAFVSLEKLIELNPHFNPLEALLFLTPNQSAELLVLTLPILPDKDTIINTLFDYLTAAPQERKLTEFLFHLVIFIERANLSCSSYKTLYTRLDLALTNVPLEIASSITYSKVTLSKHIPPGCIIYSEECPFTVANEMDICTGVNSTALQLFLDNGKTSGHFCNFAVEEIACASLSALTAQDLAMILKCDHFHYSSGSTAVWKIIFSKAFMVLDDALDLLTNSTLDYTSPSASIILDAMREIRLDTISTEIFSDPSLIQLWFGQRLRPFLPAVSSEFLSCFATKIMSCSGYQFIIQIMSAVQPHMTLAKQMSISTDFIKVFLKRNNTEDPQCVSSTNNSMEWLENNFGVFSRFSSVTDFYKLNPNFSGVEVLPLLSPKQLAEMLLLPLPTPPEKDVVINHVFDFLLQPSELQKFPEFMVFVVQLAAEVNPPCNVYEHIFMRLYGAIPSLSPQMEPVFWAYIDNLINMAPPECVPANITCPETLMTGNICENVDSSDLQFYMNMFMDISCDFTLEKYACGQVNFTANQLAALMMCDLPRNSSHSHMLWKTLLTKHSYVLDSALDSLANMSAVGPSAPEILDVISEIRVSMLTDEQLSDSNIVTLWFTNRLSVFFPSASSRFLLCLSSRNLSCQTYQNILQAFNRQFGSMSLQQQTLVFEDFVLRFLEKVQSGPGCVAGSNASAEWLRDNWGPFSAFVSFEKLAALNPFFNPLEALLFLTPSQSAQLLVLTLPILPDKDTVINTLFDYLTASPRERNLEEFLFYLVIFLERAPLSCSSFKTLYTRLDLAMTTTPLEFDPSITHAKVALSKYIPPGCIIYSGECAVTTTNETDICVAVNSTEFQLYLNNEKTSGHFCDFAVEEIACASLSALTAQDLVAIMKCNHFSNSSGSIAVWKIILSKAIKVLDEALDLLTNSAFDSTSPSASIILDAIREIRLDTISTEIFKDPTLIQLWFGQRLRPFLPAVSSEFLSCVGTKVLDCSDYQFIMQILSGVQPQMTPVTQMSVNTYFIRIVLSRNNTADPSCSQNANNSEEWLQKNMGGFSVLLSIQEFLDLNPMFLPMEALPQLTVRQLAEVAATPGQLTSSEHVTMLMKHVSDQRFASFFDDFSPAITGRENLFPIPMRSSMLEVVFDRANLSDPSVDDSVVSIWLQIRLRPLLVNLSPFHVPAYFRILTGRNCSIEQQGVWTLNNTLSTLGEDTKTEVYNQIIQSLRGPTPLRCYGDNYKQSFYSFLDRSFMGFQFPNLTTFLSLMPSDKMPLMLNSMPGTDLGNFLRRPNVLDNEEQLCTLYNNYNQIPAFLATEILPDAIRRPTLPCVWPMALSSSSRSEVNSWFDQSLKNYLFFLTKNLISPEVTYNASCFAFQKFIIVLNQHNYTTADFGKQDVYDTIRTYLTSATSPRCYDPNLPELNSTAWFAEYIGPFMSFLTLEDLQSFGSEQVLQVFTVDPLNIALLSHSILPLNLTNYYTQLIYQQNSNFNPLLLPLLCRCVAPGPAFAQLNAEQSMIILHNLTTLCTNLDPQVSAALAGNFGDRVDSSTIATLGNQSSGMSVGQIKTIKPQDLIFSLNILSQVTDWKTSQASAILQSLMTSGMFQITDSSSLLNLGSLLTGLLSNMLSGISSSQILTASKNPSIITYLMSASPTVHQTFVNKIIVQSTTSDMIIQNVPDELSTEIPRVMLQSFSSNLVVQLNKKKWRRHQAVLFFESIAVESATAYLGSPNNLSSNMLQGFTCTGVTNVKRSQIKNLIKACRRNGANKIPLVESQLTCMYNYIKGESDASSFDLYPPDVLLYYDYSLVPQASCKSYFQQLGNADFSVFSSALSYKKTTLFANARTCLGITSTNLTADTVSVLGNMCCILDGSYIQSSDPSILEKLKLCPDLTTAQAQGVSSLLISGKTKYGSPSSWNLKTLINLEMLPLYLPVTFYDNFDRKTKRDFLKNFLTVINSNGVGRDKRKAVKAVIRGSIKNRSKRAAVTDCTVGEITQVTISDENFLFNYDDINQFNNCLSATTVKDNLEAFTKTIDEGEYLKIVLFKLRQAYNTTVPEDQVQLLSAASRFATIEDINRWIITQTDTLAALMNSSDGSWDPSLAKAIISKYLSVAGNKLGSVEINGIGGTNLCTLDVEVLRNISQESIRDATALNLSNCTAEKQQTLFTIANQVFGTTTRSTVSSSSYQLTQPYIGGATLDHVRSLTTSNISMDLATFTSLNANVLLNLTVTEVKGLLGANLPDLKSYENQTVVQSWITRQLQSELNTLGLGIQGGRADPVTNTNTTLNTTASANSANTTTATNATSGAANATSGSANATSGAANATSGAANATSGAANATSGATNAISGATNTTTAATNTTTAATTATTTAATTAKTTAATTKGNGSRLQADPGFYFLALLVLLIFSHQMTI